MKKFLFLALFSMLYLNSYAYLDPGTGSYILQLLIAGIASALLAIKIFWNNIKSFFKNLFKKKRGN